MAHVNSEKTKSHIGILANRQKVENGNIKEIVIIIKTVNEI